MATVDVINLPLKSKADRGLVLLSCSGITATLTAEAALTTGERLIQEATRAIGQVKLAAIR